jgi:glutathione peroxidase
VIAVTGIAEYDRAIDRGIIAGADIVRRSLSLLLTAGVLLAAAASSPGYAEGGRMRGHDFEFTSIDGEKLPLSQYRGRPVLVVNTASLCGYTPQYQDLEALWRKYRDRGLVVVGVPSNDFGEQEPGTAKEIKQFCEGNYAVDFPLTDKQDVIGAAAHPFFRWIAEELGEAGAPRWNFHKYLIAPDGSIAGAWPSQVRPTDKEITAEVEGLLAK